MKKVIWPEGQFAPATKPGHYRSLSELVAKAEGLRQEQEEAQEYLKKAAPAMLKLLEIRFSNRQPLTIMRPLTYKTSMLNTQLQSDLDKSFYNNNRPEQAKFVDTKITINPGTQIVLKGLDPTLQEFIFQDGMGNEHAISYQYRDALMTQTDVFETVRDLFEKQGE